MLREKNMTFCILINSLALKNLGWKAAIANQVRKFENTMDLIKNVNPVAYDYLKGEDRKSGHLHMTMGTDIGQ